MSSFANGRAARDTPSTWLSRNWELVATSLPAIALRRQAEEAYEGAPHRVGATETGCICNLREVFVAVLEQTPTGLDADV